MTPKVRPVNQQTYRPATQDEQDEAIAEAMGSSDPIVRAAALEREHVIEKRAEKKQSQELGMAKIEATHKDTRTKADTQLDIAEMNLYAKQGQFEQLNAKEWKEYNELNRTLQNVRDAIKVTVGQDVGSIRGTNNPNSIFYRLIPQDMIQFFNKDDAAAQIPIGQLVSNITKLMSGTAVSKSEMERLTIWLPRPGDLNSILHQKLENFERELSRTINDHFILDAARGKSVHEFARLMGFDVADRAPNDRVPPRRRGLSDEPAAVAGPQGASAAGVPGPQGAPAAGVPAPAGKPIVPGKSVEINGFTITAT
jgi:hypothetical protein